ncbi:MAG TPA: prepilin-type N-terminal cleavage/methylation domain-containing protein [Coriobacteriia bacterium]
MWPSSSSRASASSRGRRARGFTLLEAMISLLLLVIVLIVAMTMLFQMRAFAERQQYFMLPRQAARRATDYLSYYIAGASDVNYVITAQQSPNALITYYNLNGVLTQASYNNLTAAQATAGLGDLGTDIITMVAPFNPSRYQVLAPFPPASAPADVWVNFRVGCATSDAANQAAFAAATGFDGTQSALLMLVDKTGSWAYVRIPSAGYLLDGLCSDTANTNIHFQADTTATTFAPPNGAGGLTDPVFLVAGLQVISFRVLTDSVDGVPKLQQKLGLFDPAKDNPYPPLGSPLPKFTNVMENVEDLQIAYMYPDGTIWNTASHTFGAPGVPAQAGPSSAATALDIQNVIGLRFSVTGRSPLLPIGARQLTNVDAKDDLVVADPSKTPNQHFRPRSEDHDVTMDTDVTTRPLYDQYDHYRATATLMLRNRIPRG